MSVTLDSSISVLPGVGPARTEQLAALGITTVKDLLYDAPFRYETVQREILIKDLQPDTTVCIQAEVVSKIPIRTARFKSMLKVKVQDESGAIDLTWFNTQFMLSSLKIGEHYYFTGKVSLFKNHFTITNPTVERDTPEFGSRIPVYHESSDINSRYLRKLIRFTLENVALPDSPEMQDVIDRHQLLSTDTAFKILHQFHHTGKLEDTEIEAQMRAAKHRLAFDEMYTLMREVLHHKKEHQLSISTAKLTTTNDDIKKFASFFPYQLSESQQQAIQHISLDLVQPHPMHRLVQGEVGSGKTTVAAYALWTCARQGHKAVLICPTNILATQHFETLRKIFAAHASHISIGLCTGTQKDDADILVATHAIFSKKGYKPALVVIDEEHRFGVEQRETFFKLKKKPHFLSMTATPIPRTVALTALADRDVSFITPHKDNTTIKTWVIPKMKRKSSYAWITETLHKTGGLALIVCPFIEESVIDTLSTVKSAKKEFDTLKKVFPGKKLDLLHGKLKALEKEALFSKVMAGKTDILVTTPVVEVGVDIPKANIIVIEGAERYGLAQLHQLRGRVGRRGQEAFCLLFTSDQNQNMSDLPISEDHAPSSRLQFFAKTYDGNALAEYDLKHRGSGELLGVRQHGFDSLRFASWSDTKLIETCKQELEVL